MKHRETRRYPAREFAALGGVTIRTLHYYDRLGLLRPRRTQAGHRLYGNADLEALRLVRVLRFLGLSLKKIKVVMGGEPGQLAEALEVQRGLLHAKRALLDQAIGALSELDRALECHQPLDGALLATIIETMAPTTLQGLRKRYGYQLSAKLGRLKDSLGRVKQFAALYREAEAALNDGPSSARGQDIAARWLELGVDPLGFDPQVIESARAALKETFAGAGGGLKDLLPLMTNARVTEFIQKALTGGPGHLRRVGDKT